MNLNEIVEKYESKIKKLEELNRYAFDRLLEVEKELKAYQNQEQEEIRKANGWKNY